MYQTIATLTNLATKEPAANVTASLNYFNSIVFDKIEKNDTFV